MGQTQRIRECGKMRGREAQRERDFYIAREGERQRKLFFSYRVVHKFNLAFT